MVKSIPKLYTLNEETIAKLQHLSETTGLKYSALVRLAVDRLHDHPEDWPVVEPDDARDNNTYLDSSQADAAPPAGLA